MHTTVKKFLNSLVPPFIDPNHVPEEALSCCVYSERLNAVAVPNHRAGNQGHYRASKGHAEKSWNLYATHAVKLGPYPPVTCRSIRTGATTSTQHGSKET